jgi:hypothetical protein
MEKDEMGGEEKCMQGFVGKPEGTKPSEKPGCRWEDNIYLAEDRDKWQAIVNMVMNIWVP